MAVKERSMKLLRYGAVGAERPGLLDNTGRIRDLSTVVQDITPNVLGIRSLQRLATLNADALPVVSGEPRIAPPVAGVGKFIAIGLNYSDHAAETNMPIPPEPIVFSKATSCIAGAYDDVRLPRGSTKTDWEVELGVIIGTPASYVSEAEALKCVAGYCVVNDLSEREYQLERGGSWDKGKGCDTFGPIGPYLVTSDEVGDPQNLELWLEVNGQVRQHGSTRTMIFSVSKLVSYVSQFMTLHPGDIITTGTPPGVGMGQTPPMFLKQGDVITLGIEKLGAQRQRVVTGEGPG
jgi:2-keto-4-pentenoate hydratase/2-oxohepta-3-ene-1,7-dioic acid hydratase in catechol pathway